MTTNKKEKQEKNSFDINVETFKDQGADSIFLSNSIKRPKKQDSSVQDKQTTEKSSAVENNRIKKTLKSSQNEVFGIGGKIDRFFLSGEDITLFKTKRFIRKLFLEILKHNKDPMTGLYDYDGIAQEVIDLIQK